MSFPLIANEKVRIAVENFILSNKIPHAILISGETGTGKHTLSQYIATAATCTGEKKPCGCCHGCKMAKAGSHPDIITVSKESGKKELSVAIIRNVRSEAFIKPHEAPKKVYIIEDADSMNQSAQNALLKVLEEPPESVIFILLTRSRSSLLPTVLSRCTLLSLSAPAVDAAAQFIEAHTGCDPQAALEAAKGANGNIGLAIKLLDRSAKNIAAKSADEFIKLSVSGEEYEMLKLLFRFEKDRVLTDEFLSELKIRAATELKGLPKNGKRAKVLFDLYANCDIYAEHLKLNVNLPLLFCKITADTNKSRG